MFIVCGGEGGEGMGSWVGRSMFDFAGLGLRALVCRRVAVMPYCSVNLACDCVGKD